MKKRKVLLISIFLSIIVSITGVYAITLIKASDVIYDNSKSGGSSNNVQGAIDELYGLSEGGGGSVGSTSSSRNLIKYITNLAKTDTINLAYDDTSDKNLRYIGANPNNYVEFNGELWRIIGVMNNIEDQNGKKTSRIKIIRDESLGNIVWDIDNVNDWSKSSLQKLLNNGDYYNRLNAYKESGLTDTAKSMISNVVWNLGGRSDGKVNTATFYTLEREKVVYGSNPITWTGKVGLMYPSDYGYAVGGNVRNTCLSKNLYAYNESNCIDNDWIFNSIYEWTITHNSSNNTAVLHIYSFGAFNYSGAKTDYIKARPVVYLNTNISIASGTGTSNDPYKLTTKSIYVDNSNASPPKIDEEEKLKPVKLADDGTVTFVSQDDEEWYSYSDKKWANAVILVDSPSKTYKVGDVIKESDIESYFVWIPKYKYKLWNTGTASKKVHEIEIEFDTKDTTDIEGTSCKTPMTSGSTGNCNSGEYMTHPAFISLGVDGFWVGKFETGYKGAASTAAAQVNSSDSSKVIIKPNAYSWRNNTVYNMFISSYNYERTLDSHMMKNTEWGAVAYLSHSKYGINTEININNNSSFKTGYSALPSTNQQTYPGISGDGSSYNQAYNTSIGYLASTTGNITGVYDMSGGNWEHVSAYRNGDLGSSGFTTTTLSNYNAKYFDVYNALSSNNTHQYRILGDATGEIGPFQQFEDGDNVQRLHSSWYDDYSLFVGSPSVWFLRGGVYNHGALAGAFSFNRYKGEAYTEYGSRIVLTG